MVLIVWLFVFNESEARAKNKQKMRAFIMMSARGSRAIHLMTCNNDEEERA